MIHHSSTQLQQQPPSSSQGPGPRKRAHDNGEEEGEEVIPASPLGMRAPATASTPLTARKTAMRRTPAKGSGSAAAAGRKGIMRSARPTEPTAAAGTSQSAATPAPRSTPRRQSSRIQSQRQQQQQKTPTSRYGYYPGSGNNGGIRPSQATTASQTSTPAVSPAKSSVPRPPMTMPGSSVPSLPDFLAEDGSPVELLRRTGSRAGAGESGSSSQVMMMMQDSLLVGMMRT
ncbi:hypothetical protein B0T17DRAFT_524921 [Bombardia bombarda]|uniref:Uncharacterized protein n=1 Tax=Bombardia bombarda TaxID=252184 RepID=A0AA40C9I4_9PEZI|nr:hypothetical protein B0T17DRAFT_524921 [Bombardia bombarda]